MLHSFAGCVDDSKHRDDCCDDIDDSGVWLTLCDVGDNVDEDDEDDDSKTADAFSSSCLKLLYN